MTPSPQSAEAQERDAIHAAIREAGGVVHGDGNIFFTSADKFMRARALLPSSTASGEASAVQETEAQKASEQTAADVRAIHERMKAELAHNELSRVIGSAGEETNTGRFRYRHDGPFGPDVIDSHTGKWMSIDLAREYAGVVNAATGVNQPAASLREQEDGFRMPELRDLHSKKREGDEPDGDAKNLWFYRHGWNQCRDFVRCSFEEADMVHEASLREREEAQLMRAALTVIAGWPVTNERDMDSHNMRQTAVDALSHDAQRLGRGKDGAL
jgi:hypothetical protein